MLATDHTARAVSQPHDELVPSRYALKVGEIEVLVVSDGVLPLPTQTMATNATPADLATWLQHMFMPPDAFDWPLNVLVARSGGKTILVDTGLGGQFPDFPRAGQFPMRLAAAGIDLADVTDIVITHMHMDHVGGLLVDGIKQRLRPDVRIHVTAAEVAFWRAPDFTHTSMPTPVPPVLRATATRFMEEYREQLRTFDDSCEVAPGVVARLTGGHTPGHCVVDLSSGGERLTFAGDAVFPVGFDHPDWHNGFEHDPDEAARVRIGLFRESGGERRAVRGHPSAVPVGRPGGGRGRQLPLRAGHLGLLSAGAAWYTVSAMRGVFPALAEGGWKLSTNGN